MRKSYTIFSPSKRKDKELSSFATLIYFQISVKADTEIKFIFSYSRRKREKEKERKNNPIIVIRIAFRVRIQDDVRFSRKPEGYNRDARNNRSNRGERPINTPDLIPSLRRRARKRERERRREHLANQDLTHHRVQSTSSSTSFSSSTVYLVRKDQLLPSPARSLVRARLLFADRRSPVIPDCGVILVLSCVFDVPRFAERSLTPPKIFRTAINLC